MTTITSGAGQITGEITSEKTSIDLICVDRLGVKRIRQQPITRDYEKSLVGF